MRIEAYSLVHREQLVQLIPDSLQEFDDPHFIKFVGIEGDKICGWLVLERRGDKLLLDWIRVLDEYQRKGLGTQLVEFTKEYARGLSVRGISVNTGSNTVWARSLYEKCGFQKVGAVKNYFSFDPEHIFYWFAL